MVEISLGSLRVGKTRYYIDGNPPEYAQAGRQKNNQTSLSTLQAPGWENIGDVPIPTLTDNLKTSYTGSLSTRYTNDEQKP